MVFDPRVEGPQVEFGMPGNEAFEGHIGPRAEVIKQRIGTTGLEGSLGKNIVELFQQAQQEVDAQNAHQEGLDSSTPSESIELDS